MTGSGRGYDAVIIGAGSVGVPAAYFMAQAGLRVRVLDRYASVGQGANKAAIGGVRATHSDPGKILTCSDSLEIFSTWEETFGFHIGWKEGGYCFPVFTEDIEKVLKGILPIQKKFGLEIDFVEVESVSVPDETDTITVAVADGRKVRCGAVICSTGGTPHSFIMRQGLMPVPPPAPSTVSRSMRYFDAYFMARARSTGR